MTYLWWEIDAGFPDLIERGLMTRRVDDFGMPHYELTAAGIEWTQTGDAPEAVQLP